jgi:glycosyltransferase involved in cell wall biosynthesis
MVHDSAFEAVPSAYGFLSRMYLKFMNRIIAKNAKKILVSAGFNKKEFLKYYNFSGEIKIIPLAYDKTKFNLDANKKTGLSKYILSVGRLEEKKNTKRIVLAFNIVKFNIVKKQVGDLKLVLIGRPGAGYEQVEQEIGQSEFKNDILELNSMTTKDVVEYMRGAEAFVFPSLYEGFGLPSLEAMACGTPVIASIGSAMEEVCGNAAEYCDPNNEKDIAEKILNIILDENFRQKRISLGLKKSAEFSWEKTTEQTLIEILN